MSIHNSSGERFPNLVIVALFFTVFLFTAFHEGYLPFVSLPFFLSLAVGFALAFWLALHLTTKRLLALILVIAFLEYIKETMGIRAGMWVYHGANQAYLFGVWCWVLAGLTVFALANRLTIPLLRSFKASPPSRWNLVVPPALFLVIFLFLGEYSSGAGGLFWSFYTLLLIYNLYIVWKMDAPVLMGIVITAWVGGNISEYIGAVASGAWTFPHNPTYPPAFLLFGCWPLEIVAQYALSAFLAGETLEEYAFLKEEGQL